MVHKLETAIDARFKGGVGEVKAEEATQELIMSCILKSDKGELNHGK